MRRNIALIALIYLLNNHSPINFQSLCDLLFAAPPVRIEYQELKLLFSFPDEQKDKILIAFPSEMEMDEERNIYIADYHGNTVLKYSPDGKLLKEIGGEGQGPGEFIHPFSLCYDNGKLYITDVINSRLQIFDKTGNYLSSFKIITFPGSIAYAQDELFGITISRFSNEEEYLIFVYNKKGRLLRKFGKYLDLVPNLSPFVSKALIKIFRNRVYVLYHYYPILKIFDLNGKLLQKIDFNQLNYKKLVPNNYDWSKLKIGQMKISTTWLFRAFDVTEEGIFLGLYDKDIIIDQYDYNGKFKQRFQRAHKEEDFYLFDFRIFKQNESEFKFYILNSEGIPKIDVCTSKKN